MILGVGEVLWDIFPDGTKVAGGAPFNFAFHCHQLGHEAAIVSRVGDDDLGRELREEVLTLGLSDEFIQTDPARPTGTVTVSLDAAGQPSYTFIRNPAWHNLEWTPALAALGRRAEVVCHGSLILGTKTGANAVAKFAKAVAARNGLVVFDINWRGDPNDLPDEISVFRANWIKVNVDELGPLDARVCPAAGETFYDALVRHTNRPDTVVIVTNGAKPGTAYAKTGVVPIPVAYANVVDTVGAGDAFTAAAVCLHREGKPLAECLRFAAKYAAKVCERRGATPRVDRAEVG